MGKCLPVRCNLSFTELPIQCTVEDVGKLLSVPRLAVLVSVAHFFRSGLIEEKCNKARDNWEVLELLPWLPTFVASRFVAVGEGTTV